MRLSRELTPSRQKKETVSFVLRSIFRNFAHMNEELFRTIVPLPEAPFRIGAAERVLCIGSCFADEIGRRFQDDHFPTVANPFGVMYNPASILHTIQSLPRPLKKEGCHALDDEYCNASPPYGGGAGGGATLAILTLGTNHVYIDRATNEIVDNCQKRPSSDFEERVLSVDECADYLRRSIQLLHEWNPEMKIILTVSPIRYRKYGYHESQLSKATLLMAIDKVTKYQCNKVTTNGAAEDRRSKYQSDKTAEQSDSVTLSPCYSDTLFYFPAYEILLDELRDYRFYKPDMLHPSEQAVDYIYSRFQDTFFSSEARQYVEEWRPIREALAHRPFQPDSPEYLAFKAKTEQRLHDFEQKWMKGSNSND